VIRVIRVILRLHSPFPAGSGPISVAVDPSGKFAYVANGGGGVSAYTIDSTTGALTQLSNSKINGGRAQ
jgi:6-phosphogluconolactonase